MAAHITIVITHSHGKREVTGSVPIQTIFFVNRGSESLLGKRVHNHIVFILFRSFLTDGVCSC